MVDLLNSLIQGVLLGGLYALYALGLSIAYGVMRLVNIAHGDFLILAAYLALWPVTQLGLHPFVAILPVAALMFALGYGLQLTVLNRVMGPDVLPPLLVTFGIAIILRNGLREIFSADAQSLQVGALSGASFQFGDSLAVGALPLIVFAVALALTAAVSLLFSRSRLGLALRATSDDPATAALMGVKPARTYAAAMGLSFALAAVAGVFAGIRTTFSPDMGPASLIYAFEAVVIGGLGSLWGSFAGAVILGVAQVLGAQANPGLGVLAGHVVFLAVLAFRPTGLFARTR